MAWIDGEWEDLEDNESKIYGVNETNLTFWPQDRLQDNDTVSHGEDGGISVSLPTGETNEYRSYSVKKKEELILTD
jgi:hypothetical protein